MSLEQFQPIYFSEYFWVGSAEGEQKHLEKWAKCFELGFVEDGFFTLYLVVNPPFFTSIWGNIYV